jgi:hypothetical protein
MPTAAHASAGQVAGLYNRQDSYVSEQVIPD